MSLCKQIFKQFVPLWRGIPQSTKPLSVIAARGYSQFSPLYIEPTYKPEDLDKLFETGEGKQKLFSPVKPAKNDHNSSIFHDKLINNFISISMKCGRKELIRGLVEDAFLKIKQIQLEKYHKASDAEKESIVLEPRVLFHQAIENSRPVLKLTPVKRGGIRYQVPVPITEKQSYFFAMKWLLLAARDHERKIGFKDQLAKEVIDAASMQGRVYKRKLELHKQCESNKAYAHYRWA
uniref:EOG090X0CZM n=1 Tax=Lynceus sp. MCZ IZ 141354 TaxID=1930659 RepID=A0A9N6WRJ2_9CRUS|nr:EOG090X0CZM [Lynceus sp. MCZ IZ 141354]